MNHIKELIPLESSESVEVRESDIYRAASVLKRLGEYDEAISWFNEVISGGEESDLMAGAYFHLGEIYLSFGDCEKASIHFARCLSLNPSHRKAAQLLEQLVPSSHFSTNNEASSYSSQNKTGDNSINTIGSSGEGGLKILFVQDTPCIRNYKYAAALRKMGYPVDLAYTKHRLSERYDLSDDVYKSVIKIESLQHYIALCGNYDIIHCHNEPDTLTVEAFRSGKPVIHDTHDLMSLRHITKLDGTGCSLMESLAQRGAAGCIYTTVEQEETARNLYGLNGKHTLVIGNYCSEEDVPGRDAFLPKLSGKDGAIHIVYEGGVATTDHRDFLELFLRLVKNDQIHVHVLPTPHDPSNNVYGRLALHYPRLHIYDPVSPTDIIRVMSQFDVGLIPFAKVDDKYKAFLDTTIANKLYEYLAAGIPVITSDLKSYRGFFSKHPVGFCFNDPSEITGRVSQLIEESKSMDFSKYVFTYEKEIQGVIDFYYCVIRDWKGGSVNQENWFKYIKSFV